METEDCDPCFGDYVTVEIAGNSGGMTLALADLNNDGLVDIGHALRSYGIGIIQNLGFRNLSSETVVYQTSASSNFADVEFADLDRDGNVDMVVADYGEDYHGKEVLLYKGTGNGDFSSTADDSFETSGTNPHSLVVADFNGDGWLDIVVSNNNAYQDLDLMLKDEARDAFDDAYFLYDSYDVGNQNPHYRDIGDLNADGWPDLVAGVSVDGVFVYLNSADGTGGLNGPTSVASSYHENIEIADLDLDGFDDIIAGNRYGPDFMVLLNRGTGVDFTSTTYSTDGSGEKTFSAAGDVNGDGYPDIAAINFDDSSLTVFLNDGSGGFAHYAEISVAAKPYGVAVADLDNDGRQDIVVDCLGD